MLPLLLKMKNYVGLQGYQEPKGHFQIKLPLMLMILSDQTVVQYDVKVVENTFVDDPK